MTQGLYSTAKLGGDDQSEKEKLKITFSNSPTVRGTFKLLIKSKDMKDCPFSPLICLATSFFFFSIAMATKENITFQRGMLKSIQSKVNTLASILYAAHVQCCVRGTKWKKALSYL